MKKQQQLGMNPSTASHRLVKDILWKLIVQTKQDICCKCNQPMDRDTFSIEHIIPWLNSDNPMELYFNLNNISFSHLICNIKSARNNRGQTKYPEFVNDKKSSPSNQAWKTNRVYNPEDRRARYLKYGA